VAIARDALVMVGVAQAKRRTQGEAAFKVRDDGGCRGASRE